MGCIYFLLYNSTTKLLHSEFTKSFMNMKHRGVDDTELITVCTPNIQTWNKENISRILSKREMSEYRQQIFKLGYHRSCINDITRDGMQPFEDPIKYKIIEYPDLAERKKRMLVCNGEIYNYKDLKEENKFSDKDLQSTSDVEIILPMYIKYGLDETLKRLNGDYSFVLTENLNTYNLKDINIYAVRDLLGTRPLYMIKHINTLFYMFVSELKGVPNYILKDKSYIIKEVPPGTYWSYKNSVIDKNNEEFINYSNIEYYRNLDNCIINTTDPDVISTLYKNIKDKLTESVIKRYSSTDVPIGILLSGGFDSSIILGIIVYYLYCKGHDFKKIPIHTFTIGDSTSSDVINAQKCIDFLEKQYEIDIIHHIVNVDILDRVTDKIETIINNLETYDQHTIRTSIPYIYLFEYIQKYTDIKVLLTGEGLDEMCGYDKLFEGNDQYFQNKSIDYLTSLHKFDLLRCDKLGSVYNLELRHPFLDTTFMDYILSIHPKLKSPQVYNSNGDKIEKYIIRKSFDFVTSEVYYLDDQILWRDITDVRTCFDNINEILDKYFDNKYTDEQFSVLCNSIINTKEKIYYKSIFDKKYQERL